MITVEGMMAIEKDELPEAAKALNKDDIPQLVEWLSLKDDRVRYQALLLLQNRSLFADDVYPYWHVLRAKLQSDNSYQRSIGLMLLAENAKWDVANQMEAAIDEYLALLHDEKPITIRQCIQSLEKIAPHKPNLVDKIIGAFISLDLMAIKETMRKSILLDILHALIALRKHSQSEEAECFIQKALLGGVLDNKAKKQIEGLL